MVRYEVPIMSSKKKTQDSRCKSYLIEVLVKEKYLTEVIAENLEEARKIAKNIPREELLGKEDTSTREIGRIWYGNHSC